MLSRLSFICILFLILVNLVCYMEHLYFKLETIFSEVGISSTIIGLVLVNIFLPVCHRRYHWEPSRGFQNRQLAGPSSYLSAGFFLLVLQFLFSKIMFSPDFSSPFHSGLQNCLNFPQEKSSFASFLMPSHWFWWCW